MISIIVPVFNVNEYLRHCLDSIINQTYTDFEVIMVDDGSTDGSGSICDRYAEQDSRFTAIHIENQGVSTARNTGLERIRGDYVLMVDGDDCIHERMLEILFDLVSSGDYDFAMCTSEACSEIGAANLRSQLASDVEPLELSRDDCMYNLFVKKTLDADVVWNKLYRRELLEGAQFNHDAAQDFEFNNIVYQRVNKAVFIAEPLYIYMIRHGSLQHRKLSRRFIDEMLTVESCLDAIPVENQRYRDWCLQLLYRMMLSRSFDASGTDLYGYVRNHVGRIKEKTLPEFRASRGISFVKKHALLFFLNHPDLYKSLLDFWIKLIH